MVRGALKIALFPTYFNNAKWEKVVLAVTRWGTMFYEIGVAFSGLTIRKEGILSIKKDVVRL